MYSIVIPYPSNSKCIDRCVEYIEKNSVHKNEIVPIIDEKDVYYAYNKGVYHSNYETVVLMNDDMVVSKDWDKHIPTYSAPDTVLTCMVVEANPGKMTDGPECIRHDCGDFNNFNYDKFQHFADTAQVPDCITNSMGWYMPAVFNQKTFISYPNINKFPWHANDITLFHYVLPNLGFKFNQIKSFIYHFSRQSTKLNYEEFR